jgi:peroxidase
MAHQFHSIDGSGNNLGDVTLNQAGTGLIRVTQRRPTVFDVNPRTISNDVIGQGVAEVANKQGLNELFTTFGQFIDHDLDLVRAGGADISVPIPAGDRFFPDGSVIPVTRAQVDASGNPINTITGWIDGSQIYGSDATTANALKASDGAHLLTSDGNNLPLVNGRFRAGDVRVNENDYLTSLQTVWMREHNWQVDRLAAANPTLTGDSLYQEARAIVIGELQDVVYHEWLPKLLGNGAIKRYAGYNPAVDAGVSAEFAGAAFRFGHSMVGDDIRHVGANGELLDTRTLAQDFTDDSAAFLINGGADTLLRSQVTETGNVLDARIVNSLRNFLVDGGPVSDLAATNIRRGEDFGIGTLNQVRRDLGLHEYKSFDQITNDKATSKALQATYGTVDAVDLWVGGLAEAHVKGGQVGQTFSAIISDQFARLRDGDRLWYQNTGADGPGFTRAEIHAITDTNFADIVARNTDLTNLSGDAFLTQHPPGFPA